MPARPLSVLLLAAVLLPPATSFATTVIERSLPEMGASSHLVVRGTVVDQQSAWAADHSAIETTVHVRIQQILKGGSLAKPGDTINVIQPGGVVADQGQLVPGSAHFKDGEQVVLFLEAPNNAPGRWILERLSASKFTVVTDAKGSTQAVRDVSDLSFATRGPDGRIQVTDTTPRSSFTLDEIRTALKAPLRKVK